MGAVRVRVFGSSDGDPKGSTSTRRLRFREGSGWRAEGDEGGSSCRAREGDGDVERSERTGEDMLTSLVGGVGSCEIFCGV